MSSQYLKSGVDTEKAESILVKFGDYLKTRPRSPRLLAGIGPFAACFSLKESLEGLADPLLVASCDGVGTKAKLALDWNCIEFLGQDLVAMNVNDLLCTGSLPLMFLDYYACGQLKESQLLTLLKSIQTACEQSDCVLAGGETAEMPGLYQGEDFDLGGFAVGIVDKPALLGKTKVKVGDQLIAIESSGLHSNGFSLVRKLVEQERIRPDSSCSFSSRSWKEELLAPTTLYVRPLKDWLNRIHGLAHITGEGLWGNLPRILPPNTKARVQAIHWPFPPCFQWIQNRSQMTTAEMLHTFNCGVGMIASLPSSIIDSVIRHLKEKGLNSCWIGEVISHSEIEPSVEWID